MARRDGARRQRAMRCLGRAWWSPISDVFIGAPVFVLERPVPVVPVVFFFFFSSSCVCVFPKCSSQCFPRGLISLPHPKSRTPPPTTTNTKVTPPLALVELAIALPRKSVPTEEKFPNQSIFILFIHPVKTSRGGRGSKCLTAGATRPPRLRAGTVGLRRRKRAGEGGGSETASGKPPLGGKGRGFPCSGLRRIRSLVKVLPGPTGLPALLTII